MAKTKVVRGTCTVPGCFRPHKLRGYCASHAQRFRRGVDVNVQIATRDRSPPERCIAPDCEASVKAKGLCQMHYARLLRRGYIKRSDRTKPVLDCTLPGCGNAMYAGGLCNRHYLRQRAAAEYGLTLADLEAMLAKQGGVCAICEGLSRMVARSGKISDFAIDHSHKTGQHRGLLCDQCNRGIGLLQDNPAIIRRAAAYLERHAMT